MAERAGRREAFEDSQRIYLLEVDADQHDADAAKFREEVRTELGRLKGIMLTLLISTTTAALLLALNLAVGR